MNDDRPASSATGVALARALETVLPKDQRLFEDPFAHLFLGRFGSTVLRLCRHVGTRRILLGANDRLLPGVRGISVGRTRFIDDALDAALGRGVRQVVILGAGYDTRALRTRGSESSLFFEVDHPATPALQMRNTRAGPRRTAIQSQIRPGRLGAAGTRDRP